MIQYLRKDKEGYFVLVSDKEINTYSYLKVRTELAEVVSVSAAYIEDGETTSKDLQTFIALNKGDYKGKKVYYLAKAKFLSEINYPIVPGEIINIANYLETKSILIKAESKNEAFVLGEIQGTEKLYEGADTTIKNLFPMDVNRNKVSQSKLPMMLSSRWSFEYPHIGLFGGSGSGKSHGLRVLCEEHIEKRIPSIFFDIHKEMNFKNKIEYEEFTPSYNNHGENTVTYVVGKDVGISFSQLNIGDLIGLISFINELSDPMKFALQKLFEEKDTIDTLINRVEKLKEAFENEEKPQHQRESNPNLASLYFKYKRYVSGSATLQALLWRLSGLKSTGIFIEGENKVEKSLNQRKFIVIQASNNLQMKMYGYLVTKKLYEKRKYYKESNLEEYKIPPFSLFLDEAHNFAPNTFQGIEPFKLLLKELAQESRKYGVYLILSTQRPSLLDRTIVAQLNTKIIFRTSISEDIEMVTKETNLSSEEAARLPFLISGNAYILNPKFGKTLYIRFRATYSTSPHSYNPFDELTEFADMNYKYYDSITSFLTGQRNHVLLKNKLKLLQEFLETETNQFLELYKVEELLKEMVNLNIIIEESTAVGKRYKLT